MIRSSVRRVLPLAAAVALVLGVGAPHAAADPDPTRKGRADADYFEVNPGPLDPEWLITDAMESQQASTAGLTCSYETVQSGPTTNPTSGTYQMVYVVPAGETANSWLDVPRSCSDGSLRYSSLARSSRNMASFMGAQNAGMNYRTYTKDYSHNYSGSTYTTRGVRRMYSSYTEADWNSTPMRATPPHDRLTKLINEMVAERFDKPNFKYMALLDASTYRECWGQDPLGNPYCGHIPGAALRDGQYGVANRGWIDDSFYQRYWRYGCASRGDTIFNHEATHEAGAAHVGDHSRDIMTADGGGNYTIQSSPGLLWDYGRNHYHAEVKGSGYVGLSNLTGNYFTC